jgi:hexokinase
LITTFLLYLTFHPCVPISDYLADSVDAFLTSTAGSQEDSHRLNVLDVASPAVPLGLTFSFPVEQTALDKGILLTWTKGFSAKNAVNKDVVGLLQDAFDRKHLHVKCVALVNDVWSLDSSIRIEKKLMRYVGI